jgi:hypothetical protein
MDHGEHKQAAEDEREAHVLINMIAEFEQRRDAAAGRGT